MKQIKFFVALLLATSLIILATMPITANADSSSSSSSSSNTTVNTSGNTTTVVTTTTSTSSSSSSSDYYYYDYRDRWDDRYYYDDYYYYDDDDYIYSRNGYDYYTEGYVDRNGTWHWYEDGYYDRSGNWHSYSNSRNSSSNRSNSNNSRSTQANQNVSKYYIMIDRSKNILTVWGKDNNGKYTVTKLNSYVSTGGTRTPTGTFSITTRYSHGDMQKLSDGTYAKFCVGLSNGTILHSVCYRSASSSSPFSEDVSNLGRSVTNGDIRLSVADAQWIFQNCAEGTPVQIY